MLQLINPDRYGEFIDDLAEMHRLRYRIFKERLGWDVQVSGDMEVDEFDACRPVYLLQRDDDGRVQGCVRLLPTTGPTMLRDTFPALLDGQAAPAVRRHLGKQPLRRRSLHPRGEDGGQHRTSDLRTLRRHDRVRLDAAAHRYRHCNGRPDGADSLPRALAAETSRCAACDRKNDRGRRLPRSLARATFVCSGSRRSRQARDRRGRRPTRTIHADRSDGDGGRVGPRPAASGSRSRRALRPQAT